MRNLGFKKSSVGKQGGFTLLEIMIVVAIVAILAAVAYASYQSQITKSRRATAAGCLQEGAQFMERYYTTYLTYSDATTPPVFPQCDAQLLPHYTVTLVASDTKTFTAQAVPIGGQATSDTLCGTLTINAQGVRTKSGTASNVTECW